MQDTFCKSWDYIQKGGEVRNYKPFLYRILNNLIIDEYRKKKSVSLDEILERDGVTEGNCDELFDGSVEHYWEQLGAH